ncbi:MAG TPA: phage virion morphogenesis protein [Bacteroidota bacterium]|nr:phage virion morphogenesis protein [Bacteroidota bacterium]
MSAQIEIIDTKTLESLRGRFTNLQPLMVNLAETMRTTVFKNFDTEGNRLGKHWPQLKHSTILQRQKKGYWPGKILQRTGQLKRSIQSSYGVDYAKVGTNLIYAAIHNFGGNIHQSALSSYLSKKTSGKSASKPKRNWMKTIQIPARPYMELTDGDINKLKSIIGNYLKS